MKIKIITRKFLWLLWLSSGLVHAEPINLNDFFFFLGDPVVITSDGSSATISEDPFFTPILLSNDPFLGDLEVIIAGAGVSLLFDFDFTEGSTSEDNEFGAFIIDATTGISAGSAFEFFTQDSSSGTVAFDLSSLAGPASSLGMQFELSALASDFGLLSAVTISNVRLETTAVPEPVTFLLVTISIVGMSLFRKKLYIN